MYYINLSSENDGHDSSVIRRQYNVARVTSIKSHRLRSDNAMCWGGG